MNLRRSKLRCTVAPTLRLAAGGGLLLAQEVVHELPVVERPVDRVVRAANGGDPLEVVVQRRERAGVRDLAEDEVELLLERDLRMVIQHEPKKSGSGTFRSDQEQHRAGGIEAPGGHVSDLTRRAGGEKIRTVERIAECQVGSQCNGGRHDSRHQTGRQRRLQGIGEQRATRLPPRPAR